MVELGLTKSIGVSNFPVVLLLDMLTYAKIPPANNQVEIHPYFTRNAFIEFHKRFNISVTAYAPIGAMGFEWKPPQYKDLNPLHELVIKDLATKYKRTPAQIILNWHLYRGLIIIPKTTKTHRLAENFNVFDFKMEDSEYDSITALDKNVRFFEPKNWKTRHCLPLYD